MITVITGPPCSGKSTWVQQHRQPGDLTIDFDLICQALGARRDHDQDPWLREVTAAAWAAAVRRAVGEPRHRTWIIDARPTRQRQDDYQRIRARIVRLDAARAELHRRADEAGRPPGYHERIDDFLAAGPRDPAPAVRTRW